jgi:cytosine/adenosine deaminase-related metal-dependent hydrolase
MIESTAGPGAMPGYVNSHTHIYSALAPYGMPPPKQPPRNFVEILERVWWRLDRALDERSLRASARLYAAESLLHGTTTLIDHHESPGFIEGSLDVIADACQEIGIRAVLCFGATERNAGRDEGQMGLAECRRFLRANARPLVRGLVGLHASFTVSDGTLAETAALCRELGTPCHVHVAEDIADVEDARRRGAAGPLERLLAYGTLPPGSILAHGVFLDAAQVRAVEDAGCWLVQNPRSNDGNRVGYPKHLSASARVALGTDGYPADLPVELAALERLAALDEPGTPKHVVRGRLDAGRALAAECFGAGTLDGDRIEEDAADAAFGTRASHVWVAGRQVVRDGVLLTGDIGEIRARAREEAPRLWERMAAL